LNIVKLKNEGMKKFKFETLKQFSFSHLFLLRKKMNYVLNTSDLIMILNPDSLEHREKRREYEINSENIDKALEIAIERSKEAIFTNTIGIVKHNLN
jgi:hypothetical protein